MARHNANTLNFEEVELLGKTVLFTDLRVQRETVPPDMFYYEIRHTDDDGGIPCQLAKGIVVNHFGSILSYEPFALDEQGFLDFDGWEDFGFTDGDARSLSEFRAKYGGAYAVELSPAKARDADMFFSNDAKIKELGTLGYLRCYFTDEGKRLEQVWFSAGGSESPQFHDELNTVMRKLFGQGVISTRAALAEYCYEHPEARIPGASARSSFGFKAETEKTRYYFRFNLQPGDYAIYAYCYDRATLLAREQREALRKKTGPER